MMKSKPTALKVLEGNRGKRPLNGNEPKPKLEIPPPPAELSEDARIEWDYISGRLYAVGCLTEVDRGVLAAYCQAYGRWVQAERALNACARFDTASSGLLVKHDNGSYYANPLVAIANNAMKDMVKYSIEFGMTPSARSRIHAQKPEETDAASRFFT
jgi:P27 family predicted phage terminase small subunit